MGYESEDDGLRPSQAFKVRGMMVGKQWRSINISLVGPAGPANEPLDYYLVLLHQSWSQILS